MKKRLLTSVLTLLLLVSLLPTTVLAAKNEITVYNWGQYISDGTDDSMDVIHEFEEETGIKVNYLTFDSNESMYTKLKTGGTSYDVIIPSDYMVAKLISEDMLEPIDFSNVPNFEYIDETFRNQSYDPGNAGSALSGAAVDPGNRMGDIASDDIESINVLKGAAATALYGARAKDGAVIITTKKGSKNQQTSVSINSTMRFESVLRLPDFQNSYAQGVPTTGAYSYGYQNGWGPKIEGQTVKNFLGQDVQLRAYKNNVKDFYQTGHTYINSVAVSGGDDKNDFRLGLTAHNQTGVIPNNEYDKYNVSFNGGRKFNDKLEARISFSYAHTTSQGRPAQGSNDVNVLVNQINAIPRTTDINWLKNNWYAQDGTTVTQASVDEAGKTGNLYWTVNKNKNTGTVDRMFGSAVISYKPVKGLTITNNLGTDFFEEQRRQIYAWGTVGLPDG